MLLSHALLLLLLDEEKGAMRSGYAHDAGLAGAVLLDLLAAGALTEHEGKLVAVGSPPPALNAAWRVLGEEPRSAKKAISALGKRLKPLRGAIAAPLVETGVLEERHLRFSRVRYPERDPAPELDVRKRLRVVLDGAEPDEWTASLFGLLVPMELVKPLFGRAAKGRAKEIAERGPVGDAVKAAVQAQVTAAVTAATIAATTVATSGG